MRRIFFVLVFVLLFSCVSAIPSSEEIKNDSVVKGVESLREIMGGSKNEISVDYLADSWKELFLKSKFIGNIDSAFRKIDFIFYFLFARSYDLSLTLFIAFLLWFVTFLSLEGYLIFIENKGYRTLAAFAIVVVLSHIQIFNYLSNAAFKIMFYKSGWVWPSISLVLVFTAIFVYFYINKLFSAKLAKRKAFERIEKLEQRSKEREAESRGISEGVD